MCFHSPKSAFSAPTSDYCWFFDLKWQLFSSIAMITILAPHQEQQNRQSTNFCGLCCFQLSQNQKTVSFSADRTTPCVCQGKMMWLWMEKQDSSMLWDFAAQLVLFLHQNWPSSGYACIGGKTHWDKTQALNLYTPYSTKQADRS